MISTYSIVLFFALFSMVSATGHLRLELTPSNHFAIQLKTKSSLQTLYLKMGNTRVVSFHPLTDEESIEVTFTKRGSPSQKVSYGMKSAGEVTRQTFIFNEAVLLSSSFFECDAGFYGEDCKDTSPVTTTTTMTTTTTTTVTSTTTSFKPEVTSMSPSKRYDSISLTVCIALFTVVIVLLLVLIIVIFCALRPQRFHIPSEPSLEMSKSCKITLEDSGYTATPNNSLDINM